MSCSADSSDETQDTATTTAVRGATTSHTTPSTVAVQDLGLSDEEVVCVTDELPEGVDPGAVPADVLDGAQSACIRGSVFADDFTRALAEENPGLYTEDQLVCLGEAYGNLSDEEMQPLVQAGLNPQDPPPEAAQILDELFASCDAEPPG